MTAYETNLVIQTVAGAFGSLAVASAVMEYNFGVVGHILVGIIGGALGGLLLQRLAVTLVTASGSMNEPTVVENAVLQGAAGFVCGGAVMLVVGLIKHSIDEHRSAKK